MFGRTTLQETTPTAVDATGGMNAGAACGLPDGRDDGPGIVI